MQRTVSSVCRASLSALSAGAPTAQLLQQISARQAANATNERGPVTSGRLAPDSALAVPNELLRGNQKALSCAQCAGIFFDVHAKYPRCCKACVDSNLFFRTLSYPLDNRVVLLTGARTRIGFETGLKLLRAGATLYATSRFPYSMADRYLNEPDSAQWRSNLHVLGIECVVFGFLFWLAKILLSLQFAPIDGRFSPVSVFVQRPCQYTDAPGRADQQRRANYSAASCVLSRHRRARAGAARQAGTAVCHARRTNQQRRVAFGF